MPGPKDDDTCEEPKRRQEDDKEGRRHDETVFVHGQVVVDAVGEKVCSDADAVVWEITSVICQFFFVFVFVLLGVAKILGRLTSPSGIGTDASCTR